MTHTQGPVPIDSDSYVHRPTENDVVREVLKKNWVLMLGPRQHGKTSAFVRIRQSLDDAGVLTAEVDLQAAPPCNDYSEFVVWFCDTVGNQLGGAPVAEAASSGGLASIMGKLVGKTEATAPAVENADGNHRHDVGRRLEELIPEGKVPIVILIDEASNISDNAWRNAFYGQLRAVSSRRATANDGDAAARLSFVFAGTFRPETLIDQENSPFNVCERCDTADLTEQDVLDLTERMLGSGNERIASAIYAEVGGQPFLIQRLLSRLQGAEQPDERLAEEIERLRVGDSDHVSHLFGKILGEPELTQIAARMVSDGAAPNEAADPNFRFMQVLGIARRDGTNLVFRNALYEHVAMHSPQLGAQNEVNETARVPIFAVPEAGFAKVQDAQLREIALSTHNGAVAAYNQGFNRLALAGFGGSLEAILLDLMLRQPTGQATTAAQQAGCNFVGQQNASDPKSWTLFNLMKTAAKLMGNNALEAPQSLRHWRNTIHPSVALRNYNTDADLDPEVLAAVGMHRIILRDLI